MEAEDVAVGSQALSQHRKQRATPVLLFVSCGECGSERSDQFLSQLRHLSVPRAGNQSLGVRRREVWLCDQKVENDAGFNSRKFTNQLER